MNEKTPIRIRQRREALGYNQRQAADAASLSQATWSRIESGEKEATIVQLAAIAVALNTTLEALTEDSPVRERLLFAARTNNKVEATDEELAKAEGFREQVIQIMEINAHLHYIGVGEHHG